MIATDGCARLPYWSLIKSPPEHASGRLIGLGHYSHVTSGSSLFALRSLIIHSVGYSRRFFYDTLNIGQFDDLGRRANATRLTNFKLCTRDPLPMRSKLPQLHPFACNMTIAQKPTERNNFLAIWLLRIESTKKQYIAQFLVSVSYIMTVLGFRFLHSLTYTLRRTFDSQSSYTISSSEERYCMLFENKVAKALAP